MPDRARVEKTRARFPTAGEERPGGLGDSSLTAPAPRLLARAAEALEPVLPHFPPWPEPTQHVFAWSWLYDDARLICHRERNPVLRALRVQGRPVWNKIPGSVIGRGGWKRIYRMERAPFPKEILALARLVHLEPLRLLVDFTEWQAFRPKRTTFWFRPEGCEKMDRLTHLKMLARLIHRYACPIYIRRMAMGLDTRALAERLKVSQQMVRGLEIGDRKLSWPMIKKLSKVFGISKAQMLYEWETWDVRITRDNAERVALESLWAYSDSLPKLEKDWEGGMTYGRAAENRRGPTGGEGGEGAEAAIGLED